MLILSDAEIDHDLGAIGGGGGTESVEGGVFPDPKRRRLVEKLGIAVEDDEVMEEIRKEEEDKDEKQKMEEIRKEKFKVMPPLDWDELLRIAHSSEPVPLNLCSRDTDAIMDIRDKDEDVVEEEEEVDEKVKEILDNLSIINFSLHIINFTFDSVLSLSIIFSRCFLKVEKASVLPIKSARTDSCRYFWNRLPEVDSQYVYLFIQFDKSFQQNSWHFYVTETSHANRRADFLKALDIAKTLNLDKLDDDIIHECFVDVFVERDTIAEYKLKTEYDLFLLECRYNQNLHPENFAPKERPPIMDSPYFVPSAQQEMFDSGWKNAAQDC